MELIEEERDAVHRVHRALRGLDHRDWASYREVFDARVQLDYSSWRADISGWWSADEWVGRVARGFVGGCDATQHTISNHMLSRAAGGVVLECEMRAMHIVESAGGAGWLEIGGSYRWRLGRVGDRLLVDGLGLDVRWQRGNTDLPILVAARRPGLPEGQISR